MLKRFIYGALLLAILSLAAGDVFAQSRNHGIWKPHYGSGRSSGRSYSYSPPSRPFFSQPEPFVYAQPASPAYRQPTPYLGSESTAKIDSYRSFSLEPIGVRPGDFVMVAKGAKMMLGRNVAGTAPQRLRVQVTKVTSGCLGAVVEVDGRLQKG